MPQLPIDNSNITTFRFSAAWDLYNRKVVFTDLSTYNGSSGSGIFQVAGISFLIEDQVGVKLAEVDFADASKYFVPSVTNQYELDLSSLPIQFLFQTYKIQGAIKDADGTIYYTTAIYKKICEPVNITEGGYVPGIFQITPNCPDNVLTVKELTLFTYNNQDPVSKTKSGSLYYPTGTISPVTFTSTPFSNNVIYTGEYRINCETVAEYDLQDDISVLVKYITNNNFPVTCANKIADLVCCMVDLQTTYLRNCDNAKGKYAQQQLNDISIPFMIGLSKEINGQDASIEADLIRKTLKCDCGATSVRQNEFTPINPASTSIVLQGVGGTTVPSPTVNGNTKTYNIASSVYQVVKGDTGDLAFTIAVDNTTTNVVKYKITFNYEVLATTILNTIAADSTLVNLFNSIVASSNNSSIIVNGKCIFSSSVAYSYVFTLLNIPSNTTYALLSQYIIAGVGYNFSNFSFNLTNLAALQTYLNSLGIGTFVVDNPSGNTVTISSSNNTNSFDGIIYSNNSTETYAGMTKTSTGFTAKTVSQVVQLIIDYLCNLTALQVALGTNLTLWMLDYNGIPISQGFTSGQSQSVFNAGIQNSIYNIVQRISLLTGITCEKIAAVFSEYPNLSFTGASRVYGKDGDNCVAWTDQQLALGMIRAIENYSDVKTAFCAISCTAPNVCPDITDISLSMVGNNIGIYGTTWSQNPLATQTVTVYYKKSGDVNYTVATNALNILPNGTIQSNPPYLILGPVQGETYDIKIVNNCGGVGFVKQILVPTGSVYSASYLVDNILYNICGNSPATYYTSAPFAIGVIVYTNIGLSVPLTGYSYIADSTGAIYTIDSATGEVLTDTGSSCESGIAASYILDNDSGHVCANPVTVLYTNGAFAVGKTLYTDAGLTNPVTGYSYVAAIANNHIYNLNSVTGVIGSDTALTCGAYSATFKLNNVGDCSGSLTLLFSATPFAVGVTMFTDPGLTTLATGYLYIYDDDNDLIYNFGPASAVVGSSTGTGCS